MNYPPVFQIAAASSAVTTLLGTSPVRLFLFGEATQSTVKPYAVWQTVSGQPYNTLADIANTDRYTVQIDCYATTASVARSVAAALRDAYEPAGYVTQWRGESKNTETGLFRYSFDVEFHVKR